MRNSNSVRNRVGRPVRGIGRVGAGRGRAWLVAGLVASAVTVFSVGKAGAEEIATYVFETTQSGAGEHCRARVEFSYLRRAGDRVLTADEIVDGYAVFETDAGVVAAIDLAFDDAGFGPIGIARDGTLRIEGLHSTATLGTLRIASEPTVTLGPGGGRIGLDRRTGCTFYGVWSAAVEPAVEPPTRLAYTPKAASGRGIAIIGGLGLMGAVGRHRRWRSRRQWRR